MSRKLSYSKAMSNLGTETAFEILAMAKELEKKGAKVIHMEIGEPDFDTPEHIKEAAVKALRAGYTHYTPAPGILELRQAISEKVSKERGIDGGHSYAWRQARSLHRNLVNSQPR